MPRRTVAALIFTAIICTTFILVIFSFPPQARLAAATSTGSTLVVLLTLWIMLGEPTKFVRWLLQEDRTDEQASQR